MSRLSAPGHRSRPGKRRLGLYAGPLIPRRYLLALGLLAVAALIGLFAILSPGSPPSPRVSSVSGPTHQTKESPPPSAPAHESERETETGSETETGPEETEEPQTIHREFERDIEPHPVTVSEATVHHPHHARFDLSLLALAALTLLSPFFLKRRQSVPKRLRPFVWPLALIVALTLIIFSVHLWESPKPPKLVALHTVRFHPELIPEGVETHRDGNTIHVIHHFQRNVPERKLLHVHVWTFSVAWQWPLLLLSAALAALLVGDRLVPLRKPGRGPPTTPVLESAIRESRRIQ